MVLQLFIGLLAIASGSLLITQGRRRKIWSILILASLVVVSYLFADNLSSNLQESFIYQWLPYSDIKSDFYIASSISLQKMYLPLIFLLIGLVYLNITYSLENHSLHVSVLLILSFVSLILQISCNDILQLMFAGCMFSIISFYIPDLMQSKKKMFVFNFLSEMCVFMALSIVYGKTGTTSIAIFPSFAEKGIHKDLVAFLLMFAIALKCGFFLVNGQYLSLKNALFNRINGLMVISIPLSGIILLIKTYPLLSASQLSAYVLPSWAVISILANFSGALINSNIQAKFIMICLSFYAFIAFIFCRHQVNLYSLLPYILTSELLIALIFMQMMNSLTYNFQINYAHVSWKNSKFELVGIFLLVMALIFLFCSQISTHISKIFIIFLIVVLGTAIKSVYLLCKQNVAKTKKTLNLISYTFTTTAFAIIIIYKTIGAANAFNAVVAGIFIITLIFSPAERLLKMGVLQIWQNDILNQLYERIFIRPLKFLGRVLWLAFDVVIIERSIITGISHINRKFISFLHSSQEGAKYAWLYGIALGLIIILVYLGVN